MLDRSLHQRVVRRMKRHQVDPVAESIVGLEPGANRLASMPSMMCRPTREVCRTRQGCHRAQAAPSRRTASCSAASCRQVVVDELTRNVDDFVRASARNCAFQSQLIRSASGKRLPRLRVSPAAMLRGSARPRQIARGVDERHVRERLRKVAQHPPSLRIVFFGEQSHVVAQRQQTLEQLFRLGRAVRRAPAHRPARTSRRGTGLRPAADARAKGALR